jgi:hypothetical protein
LHIHGRPASRRSSCISVQTSAINAKAPQGGGTLQTAMGDWINKSRNLKVRGLAQGLDSTPVG